VVVEFADVGTVEAGPNRERQLQQLEARLAQLLNEVRTLQGKKPPANDPLNQASPAKMPPMTENRSVFARTKPRAAPVMSALASQRANRKHAVEVQTLTRAKYNLTSDTAEALAAFIEGHVKSEVDVKVVLDAANANAVDPFLVNDAPPRTKFPTATLIVTASSEDQARIGAFIELLSPRAATTQRGDHPRNGEPEVSSTTNDGSNRATVSGDVIERKQPMPTDAPRPNER
jgi:hypothetical protein